MGLKYASTIAFYNQPLPQILDVMIEGGFDAIDIPGDLKHYAPDTIRPYLTQVKDQIELGEITGVWGPNRDIINPDMEERKIGINYAMECITIAQELESDLTHMCFMTSPANLETPRAKLEEYAIIAIKKCFKLAQDYGITLMIEPLFKQDNTLVNTADQAMDLFCRALDIDEETFLRGSDEFGLLLDVFHMHHEEANLLDTLQKYRNVVKHIHIADHPRGLDFSRSDSKFTEEAIHKIQAINYQGLVSFEAIPAVPLEEIGQALKTLKNFEI